MSMLQKTKPVWLIAGASLIIGGGAGAFWLAQNNFLMGYNPPGAKLIPQQALATLSVSTDPQQWQKLQQTGTPATRTAIAQQIQNLQQNFLTSNGFDYQQDIQPWIGSEAMIAYLPLSTETTTTPEKAKTPKVEDALILVLPVNQPLLTSQIANQINSGKNNLVGRTYQGVTIQESQKGTKSPISVTVLDNAVVVTNNPKAMDQVVDAYQGNKAIAKLPGYSQALGKLNPGQSVFTEAPRSAARLYLNLPAISTMIGSEATKPVSTQPPLNPQQYQGIATNVVLEPQGLRFQGVSWLKPDSKQKFLPKNDAKIMPQRLPADTFLMFSGSNLQQFWLDYIDGQGNPLLPISPDAVRSGLKSFTNLDLDEDLLSWMQGEFTVALLPSAANVTSRLKAGVVIMVQASDRPKAEKTLKRLDEIAANNYQFQVESNQLNGQPVTNWVSPLVGLNISHGWLDGNVAFLTFGAPIASGIVPQPREALATNSQFQQTLPGMSQAHNGKLFINVDTAINANNLPLPQLPKDWRGAAKSISTIGMTTQVESDRLLRFDLSIQLQPSK